MKKKIKAIAVILLFCYIIFLPVGAVLLKKSYKNTFVESINYKETSDVDYKVYLKENKFFETPYLEKGKVYITSLIDNIDVDLSYNIVFDNIKSGEYSYSIKGVISAELQNDKDNNYWQKEYVLIPEKKINFSDTNEVNIKENIKVDYQNYNDILMEFKKQYSLSMNGSLKIYMTVKNVINSEFGGDDFIKEEEVSLTIPLTKSTIEVPIEINCPKKEETLNSDKYYLQDSKYKLFRIGGFTLIGVAILSYIFVVIVFIMRARSQLEYIKKLRKILKTYDSIIITVKKMPSIEDLQIIEVKNFNELLDAHSELRLPINFCDEKDKATFLMINDKIAWRYTLSKDK